MARRIRYTNNKQKKLRKLWNYRKNYKDNVLIESVGIKKNGNEAFSFPPSIDLIYGRPTYGRVNFDNEPVVPNERRLVNADRSSTSNQIFCHDFVAAAFADLNSFITRKLRAGSIDPGNIILPSGLQPVRGATSVGSMQDYLIMGQLSYFNNMLVAQSESLRKRNKIRNIENYLTKFTDFVQANKVTMTKTAVIMGNAKGILDTGLAIDVSHHDQGDDVLKVEVIHGSRDWNYFRWAARDYGFMVDKNVPWRLVADLASPIMQEYMLKHKTSLETVFNTHFKLASSGDANSIQNVVLNGYNALASKFTLIRDVGCKPCGTQQAHGHFDELRKFKIKTTVRNSFRTAADNQGLSRIPTGSWLVLYAHIKNSETNFLYDQTKMENIIRDAKEVLLTLDNNAAASYIESMFQEAILFNALTDTSQVQEQPETPTSIYTPPSAMATTTNGSTGTGGY